MNYTITEDQIKSIAEGGGKKKIKEMFPQVFGTKLEVGKWYKYKKGVFFIKSINGFWINVYGTNKDGEWMTDDAKTTYNSSFKPATNEEVEAALIAELVKRYGADWETVKLKNHADSKRKIFLNIQNYNVEIAVDYGTIWNKNGVIFYNGVFAEILQEKTLSKSEAEELITTLKNDGCEYKIV